jgi:2-(1,2-epoxy-1,2-dihydrophenyl)acetyl-CoA isomerase
MRLGLVNEVVPRAELMEVVRAWADRLAAGPPLALALIKEELNASVGPSMSSALQLEGTGQATSAYSEDVEEGIASFLEKRPPAFRGR